MRLGAVAASAVVLVGCFHDFDAFDPAASARDDGGGVSTPMDAGFDATMPTVDAGDAQVPLDDSAPTQTGDGSPGCGADCRIEATSCAGTCAEIEQSCAAACDGGACTNACVTSESSCTANCVTECETCTSGEGCIDKAGCAAAAP